MLRGAGCCQQVRVSLVVAETMACSILCRAVRQVHGSSSLRFYFIFDLNFYFVYVFLFDKLVSVGQLPGQLLQLDLRASAGNHALSVTKHQMLRWGFKQLFYYFFVIGFKITFGV